MPTTVISDALVWRGYSLTLARKTPIVGGLVLSTGIAGTSIVSTNDVYLRGGQTRAR